jgi:hypothetical protein
MISDCPVHAYHALNVLRYCSGLAFRETGIEDHTIYLIAEKREQACNRTGRDDLTGAAVIFKDQSFFTGTMAAEMNNAGPMLE